MANYINTQTGAYPVSQQQIQSEYPNTSFPNPFVPPAPYQVVLLSPVPPYDTLTQGVKEVAPEETGGQYYQAYEVYNLTPEQIQYNKDQLAQQNKNTGKQLLSNTDWTAIPSVADPLQSNPYLTNQDAFFAYRSAVRDIVLNPTYDAVFPEEPVEIWSAE
jgi:hypothetical protein